MKRFVAPAVLIALLLAQPALAAPAVLTVNVDHGAPLALSGAAASVFVANPAIADVQIMSPTQVMIFGKKAGETSFMASDRNGKALAERTILVTQDLTELRAQLDAAIPGNKITAKSVPNGIVLTGQAADPAAVADANKIAMHFIPTGGDVVNRVQIGGSNQIMIRVRFAEVSRTVNDTLGFNWQNAASYGGFVLGLATGNVVNGVPSTTAGTIFNSDGTGLFPRPNNATIGQSNDVIGIQRAGSHLTVGALIDALAQDGLATILAEPNLTAMSGQTATFLAGGEFPIPVPQQSGTISIDYKSYGVSLSFTPTLLNTNRISLHVKPEVSELTTAGAITIDNISVPALTTRRAETSVEVASGESFAIAGLMDNTQAQSVTKYPFLGDLPVLGALFRSNSFQTGQTELVVVITPYIVKPSDKPLALPTDGLAVPGEAERTLQMRQTGTSPDAHPISGDPLAVQASPVAAVTAAPAWTPVAPARPVQAQPTPTEPAPAQPATADVSVLPPDAEPGPAPASAAPLAAAPQAAPVVLSPPAQPAESSDAAPIVVRAGGDSQSGGLLVE